jgi:transposase
MGRESREVWEKRVARWRESGLSAREFAAEVGIKAGTLGWWSSRLRQGEPGEAATGPHRRLKERTERTAPAAATTPPVKWVEVVGVEGHTAQRDGAAAPMPVFELLVAGRTIRVPAGFDADSLRRLIAVVEAR